MNTTNSNSTESVTRSELVVTVSSRLNISESAAREVVDSVLESITDALTQGRKVSLYGFGSFLVKHQSARTARNIRTGAPIQVPERRRVTFKPSRPLTESVNE